MKFKLRFIFLLSMILLSFLIELYADVDQWYNLKIGDNLINYIIEYPPKVIVEGLYLNNF